MDQLCSGCRQSLAQTPTPATQRRGQVPHGCSSPRRGTGQPEPVQRFKSQDSMAELVTSAHLNTSGAVAPHLKNKLFSTAEGQSKLSSINAWGWVCT